MTKSQLQQELKEKVKAGIKPSHLKRSKSAGDLPATPLTRTRANSAVQSNLELQLEIKKRELAEKDLEIKELKKNPPTPLLQDQLNQKQSQIESLTKLLETANQELQATKQELDNSLVARVAGIKIFGQEHAQRIQAQQELNETVDEASTELITSDKQVSQLRTKLNQANQQIQQLQQDLKWERIKRNNSADDFPNLNYLKYTLYSLLAIWFISLLNRSWNQHA